MRREDEGPPPDGPVEFDEYYRSDEKRLFGFLLKIGANFAEAEDTVQTVMADAFERWDQIDRPSAWARRAAERTFLNSRARSVEEILRLSRTTWAMERPVIDPERFIIREEGNELVKLMQELPFKQRRVLAWHLDGFDHKEIAQIVDTSEATVASNLRYAKSKIKAMMIANKVRDSKAVGGRTNDEQSGL